MPKTSYGTDSKGGKRDASGLSEGEREQLKKLKSRDTEVRNHENAHQSAGGQFAGSPSYTLSDRAGWQTLRHRRRSLDRCQSGKRSGGNHRQDGKRQARRDRSGGTVAPGLQGGRRRPAHDDRGPAGSRRREARSDAGERRDGRGRAGKPGRKTTRVVRRRRPKRHPPPSLPPCRLTRAPPRLSARRNRKAE